MAINFPTSPNVNDTHTDGDMTWKWDGSSWEAVMSGAIDPTVGGDLTGTASNAQIVAGSIGTTELADNSVTSDKIGVDVIVAEDIAANAITVAELQDDAVTTAKIATDAVTTAKIATDAVTANEIAAGAVTTGKIARAGTSGQVLTSAGTSADPAWTTVAPAGITYISQWRLGTTISGSHDPIIPWEECPQVGETGYRGYKRLGSAMAVDTGVFTFPTTGYWQVTFKLLTAAYGTELSDYSYAIIKSTVDGGTSWTDNDYAHGGAQRTLSDNFYLSPLICQCFFGVTDTSTHKVEFEVKQHQSNTQTWASEYQENTFTTVFFTRLAGL